MATKTQPKFEKFSLRTLPTPNTPLVNFAAPGVSQASASFNTTVRPRTLSAAPQGRYSDQFVTATPMSQRTFGKSGNDVYETTGGQMRHIGLDEFRQLGLNFDHLPSIGSSIAFGYSSVPSSVTPAYSPPSIASNEGYKPAVSAPTAAPVEPALPPELQALYDQLKSYLEELKRRGQVLNPNIELTPEKLAEFTRQAESEINPYFQTQLKIAREGLLRSVGYGQEQLSQFEQELEKRYGRQVRQIGEQAAERGFAQSGIRKREEQELAGDTQSQIEENRRQLGFNLGSQARTFAQNFGTPDGIAPQIGTTPTVVAGQGTFNKNQSIRDLPYYELSPDTYKGLIGEQDYQRRGSVRSRASELEGAFRTQEAIRRARELNL